MILTCPACGTQYVVKDEAIPPQGRQVRCSACRHRWHQDPEPAGDEPDEAVVGEAAAHSADADEQGSERAQPADIPSEIAGPVAPSVAGLVEPPLAAPVPPPEEEQPGEDASALPALGGAREEADEGEDIFSPFARRDEEMAEDRRRKPLLMVLAGVLLIAAIAAAFWFLAPSAWKQQLGLTAASETPLQLMMTHRDRQKLASGNEVLTVSGRVINPTSQPQQVPAIHAQLHSRNGELIYSWTIAPPARTLPPGGSASFNSTEVDVPSGGDDLTISLGEPA